MGNGSSICVCFLIKLYQGYSLVNNLTCAIVRWHRTFFLIRFSWSRRKLLSELYLVHSIMMSKMSHCYIEDIFDADVFYCILLSSMVRAQTDN